LPAARARRLPKDESKPAAPAPARMAGANLPVPRARRLRNEEIKPERAPASMSPEPFSFPVRVYYEDTDAAGVVYYANYLRFMERARTEWLTARGFELAAVEREHGIAFAVHHADIRYHLPARLGDRLDVSVTITERGRARLVAWQEVRRGGTALVDARITLACIDRCSFRPTRIPASLAASLETAA
jgi:acyl-CoA thioester hydrolase